MKLEVDAEYREGEYWPAVTVNETPNGSARRPRERCKAVAHARRNKADGERPLWRDKAPLRMLILQPGGFSARDPFETFANLRFANEAYLREPNRTQRGHRVPPRTRRSQAPS